MNELKLSDLRKANVKRCRKVFPECKDWTLSDWGCAIAGEVGEACNAIKKLRRGDGNAQAIIDELGDVIVYVDLILANLGESMSKAVVNKFNIVSDRKNCNIKL